MERRSKIELLKRKLFVEKDNKVKGLSIFAVALFCFISFLIGYFLFRSGSDKNSSVSIDNISDKFVYKTSIVKLLNEEQEINLYGKVYFDENRIIKIFPAVNGKATNVKVSLGSYVKKGEELIAIKSPDVSDLLKEHKVAEANYQLAKKNLKIAEELFRSKFSSELDVLTARKDLEKSSDELKKTSEALKVYDIRPGEFQPFLIIKSPIDGFIVEKNINTNMLVRSDNPEGLFTISDLKTVWILANVFEEDVSEIKEGQAVSITTEVYPDTVFTGIINNVSHVLDPASRAMRVRIAIDNPEGKLRPEMFARVQVHVRRPAKFLAVPPQALIFDKDKYFLLQVSNRKFKVRTVKVADKKPMLTFIDEGIAEGDTIVTEGSILLYNQIVNRL